MAAANKTLDITGDPNNKKIIELKKKLLLAEGQKKAYIEEWEQKEKKTLQTISEVKKDVKELTARLTYYNNITVGKFTQESYEALRKVIYPPGAETAEQALELYDLKIIDLTKQSDVLNAKYNKRKLLFDRLHERYQELLALKNDDFCAGDSSSQPIASKSLTTSAPQTVEEDENRKLICHLENEIHRTNVQWTEAEHIRKKYKSIKATLMADAEKFEKSLLELEDALREQQADISRMQEIHSEAIQMRDATKIALLRQEHNAHSSAKYRERQAFDFRRQVAERKTELERLERKLFTTSKTVLQQGSTESLSGDAQLTAFTAKSSDPTSANQDATDITHKLEVQLKILMNTTGATTPKEVLQRFTAQKEASSRLNYLRTVTEGEKKHLEMQRDQLMTQLESFKFSDTKESEVNQEYLERLKNDLIDQRKKENGFLQAADHSKIVLNSIKSTIVDLILKLQEIDETIDPMNIDELPFGCNGIDFTDLSCENISNELLLQLLEAKLKRGLISTGQFARDEDSGWETDGDVRDDCIEKISEIKSDELFDLTLKLDELKVPGSSSANPSPRPQSTVRDMNPSSILIDKERPTPYPSCYANLLAGRTTGISSSASPGQTVQQVVTDDEGEVPSRNFLKRQALVIVDSKSRRKGYRAPAKKK